MVYRCLTVSLSTDGDDHECQLCHILFTGKLFLLKHLKYRHHQFVDLTLYQSRNSPVNRSLCKVTARHPNSSSRASKMTQRPSKSSKLLARHVQHDESVPSNTFSDMQSNQGNMFGKQLNMPSKVVSSDHDKNGRRHDDSKSYRSLGYDQTQGQCDICGKRFSCKGSLKIHERIHTGKNLFECDKCGKRFTAKSNLEKHKMTHTGIKPYQCTQCSKSFNQSSNLNTHERIHVSEKLFKCAECGKGFALKEFTQESNLSSVDSVRRRLHVVVFSGSMRESIQVNDPTNANNAIRHLGVIIVLGSI